MDTNKTLRNGGEKKEPLIDLARTTSDQGGHQRSSSYHAGERKPQMKKTYSTEEAMPPLLHSASTPTHHQR